MPTSIERPAGAIKTVNRLAHALIDRAALIAITDPYSVQRIYRQAVSLPLARRSSIRQYVAQCNASREL
jgi:hypothetical protein